MALSSVRAIEILNEHGAELNPKQKKHVTKDGFGTNFRRDYKYSKFGFKLCIRFTHKKVIVHLNEKAISGQRVPDVLGCFHARFEEICDESLEGWQRNWLNKGVRQRQRQKKYKWLPKDEVEFTKVTDWYFRTEHHDLPEGRKESTDQNHSDMGGSGHYQFDESRNDDRDKCWRNTSVRPNQEQFRHDLIALVGGGVCSITGCAVADVVQAAHIADYLRDDDNHMENGILLRADIHQLFDKRLLGINPQTLEIRLAPAIRSCPSYEDLHGRKLRIDRKISKDALTWKWDTYCTQSGDAGVGRAGEEPPR